MVDGAETMCKSGHLGGLDMDAVYDEMDVTFHSMIYKNLLSSKDEHKDTVRSRVEGYKVTQAIRNWAPL